MTADPIRSPRAAQGDAPHAGKTTKQRASLSYAQVLAAASVLPPTAPLTPGDGAAAPQCAELAPNRAPPSSTQVEARAAPQAARAIAFEAVGVLGLARMAPGRETTQPGESSVEARVSAHGEIALGADKARLIEASIAESAPMTRTALDPQARTRVHQRIFRTLGQKPTGYASLSRAQNVDSDEIAYALARPLRVAPRAQTPARASDVFVVLHATECSPSVYARPGRMAPTGRLRLRNAIAALLSEFGLYDARVTIGETVGESVWRK